MSATAVRGPRTGARRTLVGAIRSIPNYLRLLWGLFRDRRVAILDKVLVVAALAYAISPIDLIPDFIPVLGYLDDLLIVPAGIWLVVRLIPADVLADLRKTALERQRPVSRGGLLIVVIVWSALLWAAWHWWTMRG